MARSVASAILLGEDGPGSDADGWAREGVLQLAKAWLALRGETYIESKWTDLQLARVEQTGGRMPTSPPAAAPPWALPGTPRAGRRWPAPWTPDRCPRRGRWWSCASPASPRG
ncbi:hypothetical protein ACFSSF_11680 [Dietzia aerolata]|uniref:hypothetical protein n=1 Tax=Dietzia aerolata TaxID=595984 RepID=UPI003645F43A